MTKDEMIKTVAMAIRSSQCSSVGEIEETWGLCRIEAIAAVEALHPAFIIAEQRGLSIAQEVANKWAIEHGRHLKERVAAQLVATAIEDLAHEMKQNAFLNGVNHGNSSTKEQD